MSAKLREKILNQRISSEYDGLLNDIQLWEAALPPESSIRFHVQQFELLCTWMDVRLKRQFGYKPSRWPSLDPSTFATLIVNVLGGKWVLLRQAAMQRGATSPYLAVLQDFDGFADNCYQRMRLALHNVASLEHISASSPLVYLGPIARTFLFDEQAPCLISTPFGAANSKDQRGQDLCRQTIPHEVGHAIFDQVSGLIGELQLKINLALNDDNGTNQVRVLRPIILNWLEEIVADMTGTALAGLDFAESARELTIMPDKLITVTDANHPLPLLRSFVHGWVLEKLYPDSASGFNRQLTSITQGYLDQPFESLPAMITINMAQVKAELMKVVQAAWELKLETLKGHTLGEVLQTAMTTAVPPLSDRALPEWGKAPERNGDLIFRLVGPIDPTSPLPGLPLYLNSICCPLKLQFCCSYSVL